MIRGLGSLLLFGAFGWAGLGAARELRRRTEVLAELVSAIDSLEREMGRTMCPLPELLERVAEQNGPPLKAFFTACARHARRPEPSFYAGWEQELETLVPPPGERALRCLDRLGKGLGRFEEGEERRLLRITAEELRDCLAEARELCVRRGRVYAALGVTAGAFCVILLI